VAQTFNAGDSSNHVEPAYLIDSGAFFLKEDTLIRDVDK
jgi:hypothetical protein